MLAKYTVIVLYQNHGQMYQMWHNILVWLHLIFVNSKVVLLHLFSFLDAKILCLMTHTHISTCNT
jgi:hypothetical protein